MAKFATHPSTPEHTFLLIIYITAFVLTACTSAPQTAAPTSPPPSETTALTPTATQEIFEDHIELNAITPDGEVLDQFSIQLD